MFGAAFGHGTLRKYVVYFGTLFNNLHLNRYDSSNTLVQNMKVPLNYGPKEKFLARVEGNPDLDRAIAIQLPRMSFEFTGFKYDSSRKLNKLNKIAIADPDSPGSKTYQYSPVPYDISFSLHIMVKNAEDGTYIIEQILPYFTPEWTATLNINTDLNAKYDVPIVLDDVSGTDTYEGDFITRRAIIWTLQFTMKAWFFGPTRTGGKIIKDIDINVHVPPIPMELSDAFSSNTSHIEYISITPGLDANGDAVSWSGTPDAANRPTTVAANTITADDDYGFMIDLSESIP